MQFDRFQNISAAEKQQFADEGSFMRGEVCFWPWKVSQTGETWFYAVEKAGESHPGIAADDKEFSYPMIHGGPVAVEFETNKPPSHLMMASEPVDAEDEPTTAEGWSDEMLDPDFARVLQRMEAADDDDERDEIWSAWLLRGES